MPRDASAKASAERLLLLTEALIDTVAGDRQDELGGLLQSRQDVIERLATMDIDPAAAATMEHVTKSEQRLMEEMRRSQAALTSALIQTYSKERNVRAYRGVATSAFQRTG